MAMRYVIKITHQTMKLSERGIETLNFKVFFIEKFQEVLAKIDGKNVEK